MTGKYMTRDGREWDLGEEFTANGFHYRWDGMEFGASGPFMAAVGRPGVFVALEALVVLDRVGDADIAEGAVPDHTADPATCHRCRVLRGESDTGAVEDTVETPIPLGGAA